MNKSPGANPSPRGIICYMDKTRFLYLNGLGDGQQHWHEKLVMRWWDKHDTPLEHFSIDWYAEPELEQLVESISQRVDELLRTAGRVAIIGSSASGSLAINILRANKGKDVVVINAHGRLAKGNYSPERRMSLENRAKESTTFYQSVEQAEVIISDLTEEEKRRILVLTQLTDMVVPLETMAVPGAKTHQSIAFGHSGGFLAHLIADRDMIVEFAREKDFAK
jgi:hypothetical protein